MSARPVASEPVVSMVQTQTAVLAVTESWCYKWKRPAYHEGLLDYRTPARRRRAVAYEYAINRALRPDVYQGLTTVRITGGTLTSGCPYGHPALRMKRFEQDRFLNSRPDQVTLGDLRLITGQLRAIHRSRAPGPGRWDRLSSALAGRINGQCQEVSTLVGRDCSPVAAWLSRQLAAALSGRRPRLAYVHGDLHLGNIVREGQGFALIDLLDLSPDWRFDVPTSDYTALAVDLAANGRRDLLDRWPGADCCRSLPRPWWDLHACLFALARAAASAVDNRRSCYRYLELVDSLVGGGERLWP